MDEARATNELARLERLEGNHEEAKRLLERSIEILSNGANVAVLAWSHREMGVLLSKTKPSSAQRHLWKARDLFERVGDKAELGATYKAVGDLMREQKKIEPACDAYSTGIQVLVGSP